MHIAMRPITTQKLSSSGTSSATDAFGNNIEYVRIVADADCHIEFGIAPTATSSKIFLPAKDIEYFKVSGGEKVAAIGTANLYVTELTE